MPIILPERRNAAPAARLTVLGVLPAAITVSWAAPPQKRSVPTPSPASTRLTLPTTTSPIISPSATARGRPTGYANAVGANTIAVGAGDGTAGGNYQGQSAIAFGFSEAFSDEHTVVKLESQLRQPQQGLREYRGRLPVLISRRKDARPMIAPTFAMLLARTIADADDAPRNAVSQDTVVRRWRDRSTNDIYYIYPPITVQHSARTPTGDVQDGANSIGTISCVPRR